MGDLTKRLSDGQHDTRTTSSIVNTSTHASSISWKVSSPSSTVVETMSAMELRQMGAPERTRTAG